MSHGGPELQLPRDRMRQLGHEVIDTLVAHLTELATKPQGGPASPEELERLLAAALPAAPREPDEVLDELRQVVLHHQMHPQHPRFFGFVPSPSNYVSVLGDALASGFNTFAGTWLEGSAAAVVEMRLVRWLADGMGMPESAGGLFTTGGSMANAVAIATARETRLGGHRTDAIVYASDEAHSSFGRGLRFLGFAPDQFRVLPADDAFRLCPDRLRDAVAADRRRGHRPFVVVACAGTTNTGAVDPLPELADLCADEGLWLHVDGAFGAAVALVPEERHLVDGIERADSVMIAPHKWLFQPYDIGCLVVRDVERLRRAFYVRPPYLEDTAGDEDEVNLCEYGPELTRSFRALKLWMSVQVFGTDAFAAAIRHGLELTREAGEQIERMAGWSLVAPPRLGVVAFRYAPEDLPVDVADHVNASISTQLRRSGRAFVSTSRIRDRVALRLCPINPRTTRADLDATLAELDRLARSQVVALAGR